MDLVSLKGVGRARARILYDRGIRSINDIASKDVNELGSIPGIGYALANKIKEQTGGRQPDNKKYIPRPIDEEEEETVPAQRPKQSRLLDF